MPLGAAVFYDTRTTEIFDVDSPAGFSEYPNPEEEAREKGGRVPGYFGQEGRAAYASETRRYVLVGLAGLNARGSRTMDVTSIALREYCLDAFHDDDEEPLAWTDSGISNEMNRHVRSLERLETQSLDQRRIYRH